MYLMQGRFVATLALLMSTVSVHAQEAPKPATASHDAGRDLTLGKCFQCHGDAMWRDQRQDERAWQATLYRMMARGAVWSDDDIKTMAAFLATDYGPGSPRTAPASK